MISEGPFPIDQPCAETVAAFQRRVLERWGLQPRESRVLLYAVCGMTLRKHVAAAMQIADGTVRSHWTNIYSKMKLTENDAVDQRCTAVLLAWSVYGDAQRDAAQQTVRATLQRAESAAR